MTLKSIAEARQALAALAKMEPAYNALLRAMNGVAAAYRELPEAHRAGVFDELETELMEWLTSKLPDVEVSPAPDAAADKTKRPYYGGGRVGGTDGVTQVLKRWLFAHPEGGTPTEIYEAVKDVFETTATDKKAQVDNTLYRWMRGADPLVTRENGAYKGTARLRKMVGGV